MDSQLLLESVHHPCGNNDRQAMAEKSQFGGDVSAQTIVSMTVAATLGKQDRQPARRTFVRREGDSRVVVFALQGARTGEDQWKANYERAFLFH
jgi:hypothetical protein